MKAIKAILILAMLAVTGGCAIVPVGPGYYASAGYSAPAYYGPSIGIGVRGGGHGRRY